MNLPQGSAPHPAPDELTPGARRVLEAHWQPEGYCSPNPVRYPWQWLWDSCFHSVVWAALGDERALTELRSCFRWQSRTGFVPHMGYQRRPDQALAVWGRSGASTITQPPMFGHAAAELARRGFPVDEELTERLRRAFHFLLTRRRTDGGLILIVHPWESGADDTPRWDTWTGPPPFSRDRWLPRKLDLLNALELSPDFEAVGSTEFSVAPASFNALVAFNLRELASVTGDASLASEAQAIVDAAEGLWDEERATWVDWSPRQEPSLRARTLDALLMTLVSSRADRARQAFATIVDDALHGARFGPTTVSRAEPCFDPAGYWRGSTWPQVNYLLWVAASRRGFDDAAAWLAGRTVEGALRTGFAEYWHPDSGQGMGATPQTWTTLSTLMTTPPAGRREEHPRSGHGRRG